MNNKKSMLLAIVVASTMSNFAQADVVVGYDPRFSRINSKATNITTDTDTGLVWVVPYSTPIGEPPPEARLATQNELRTFFVHIGLLENEGGSSSSVPTTHSAYNNAQQFLGPITYYMGSTEVDVYGVSGMTADIPPSGVGHYYASVNVQSYYPIFGTPSTTVNVRFNELGGDGKWLVYASPVPEPSTLAMAGVGAFGLIACVVRRRFVA